MRGAPHGVRLRQRQESVNISSISSSSISNGSISISGNCISSIRDSISLVAA